MSPDPSGPEFQVEPGPDWLTRRQIVDEIGVPESSEFDRVWADLEAAASGGGQPCLRTGPVAWAWLRSGSGPVFAVARSSLDTFRDEFGSQFGRAGQPMRPSSTEGTDVAGVEPPRDGRRAPADDPSVSRSSLSIAERAAQADISAVLRLLAEAPDVSPDEGDELPSGSDRGRFGRSGADGSDPVT